MSADSQYKVPPGIQMEGADNAQLGDTTKPPMEPPGSNGNQVTVQSKQKKKVIYFADGSTLEDDDEDSSDKQDSGEAITKTVAHSSNSVPPVDSTKLNWPEWMKHYGSRAGTKTLSVLEGMGGTAAYYLGITTPKYQSEIDEYNRMVVKKNAQDQELMSWSSGPPNTQQPVVEEVKNIEGGGEEKSPQPK